MGFTFENPDIDPHSSFQFPVSVPLIDPMDGTFVSVQFPEEYASLILGCLMQLLEVTAWDTDDDDVLGTAITRCNQLIYLFGERTLLIPPGSIIAFAADTAPLGWHLCDGAALSRVDFAALFAAIGVVFGAGDGSTTFNVPDLRSRVLMGAGLGPGLSEWNVGDAFGDEKITLDIAEMPAHTHTEGAHTHTVHSHLPGLAVSPGELPVSLPGMTPELSGATAPTTDSTGSDQAHDNIQPFLAASYIIKV